MSGNLSNLGYGWDPLTSGMHITGLCESSHKEVFYMLLGCYNEFLRMHNRYAQATLLYTKLLKQPFGFLRNHGYASVVYIVILMFTVWRIFMLPDIYLYPWGSLSIMTHLCFNQLNVLYARMSDGQQKIQRIFLGP